MSKTQEEVLTINGMHCDHCVDTVHDALSALDGVSVRTVTIGTADVQYDPTVVSRDEMGEALREAGYTLEE